MPCPVPAARGVDASRSRTLNALVLEDRPHPSGPGPRRRGLYVDVETTGFDSAHDAIIELGMLPFSYTLEGAITDVHRDHARTWRQDPGRPVPPEITRITGLTDHDLGGEAIDIAAADELVGSSHTSSSRTTRASTGRSSNVSSRPRERPPGRAHGTRCPGTLPPSTRAPSRASCAHTAPSRRTGTARLRTARPACGSSPSSSQARTAPYSVRSARPQQRPRCASGQSGHRSTRRTSSSTAATAGCRWTGIGSRARGG